MIEDILKDIAGSLKRIADQGDKALAIRETALSTAVATVTTPAVKETETPAETTPAKGKGKGGKAKDQPVAQGDAPGPMNSSAPHNETELPPGLEEEEEAPLPDGLGEDEPVTAAPGDVRAAYRKVTKPQEANLLFAEMLKKFGLKAITDGTPEQCGAILAKFHEKFPETRA